MHGSCTTASMAKQAQSGLRGADQLMWLESLERETENLGRVVTGSCSTAATWRRPRDYLWSLYLYLWIGGYLGVVRTWGEELLDIAAREGTSRSARRHAPSGSTTRTPRASGRSPDSTSCPVSP